MPVALEAGASASAISTSVGEIVSLFTTNVVPLVTSQPMVYFFAASLLGVAIGIFGHLRGVI